MSNLEKVLSNDKRYEDYAAKHTAGYGDIASALEEVKKFIIAKNLIIYGGMAIDLALKAKGHKGIYKDDAVPDYDFMSPLHYEHACELAIVLSKKGFKECQAINAIHVSTYRVRTNFTGVADITYVPEAVFKTIPTVMFQGMRVVHPNFQRLDFHRAMCTPLEKPPQEVFFQRGRKDQKRFRLIDEQYPIAVGKVDCEKPVPKIWEVPKSVFADGVIGGSQAYCVIWTALNEIINTGKLAKTMHVGDEIRKMFASLPSGGVEISGDNIRFTLGISCPLMDMVNVITDNYEGVVNVIGEKLPRSYFNKYVDDWRPRTVVVAADNLYEVFDNKPRLLPVYDLGSVMKILEMSSFSGGKVSNIKICTPQYILMYYLQKYFGGGFLTGGKKPVLDKPGKQIFLRMYVATMKLIEIAEKIYQDLVKDKPDHTAVDALFAELPFFLSAGIYGTANWSPDYIVGVREGNYFIHHVPQSAQPVMKPPRGYYLNGPIVPFDRSKSEFFQFDGLECAPFTPVELMNVTKVIGDTASTTDKIKPKK